MSGIQVIHVEFYALAELNRNAPGTGHATPTGDAGQLQTFGSLSGACAIPAGDIQGFLMPRSSGMFEPACYLIRPEISDGESLRAGYVTGTVFSSRAHVEQRRPVSAQLRSMQLFGSNGRYQCCHGLLFHCQYGYEFLSRGINVAATRFLKNTN